MAIWATYEDTSMFAWVAVYSFLFLGGGRGGGGGLAGLIGGVQQLLS